jgi:hypothetical protein|tara:strand:- start:73 stop:411 length:339 start_codon:yes stop_codon:yes gene_type:complete
MGIRYNNRRKITNSDEIYEELFDGRGVKEITSYGTARFKELTIQNRYSLTNKHHMWSTGDSFWKLASEYYGSPGLWWIIAWYNQKPTESHVQAGESIAIPLPLDKAMKLFRR